MTLLIQPYAEPIAGYRLIERLGRGGCGEVWRAEAPGGMHKAIKFVFGTMQGVGSDGQAAEQELKSLDRVKSIRHPFILSIERVDIIDNQLVIVMELADRNLFERFTECVESGLPGIPREELLGYMSETAEALDLMNTKHQLQHLDVKPQNLFLIHNHIKVADFGLAKDLEGARAALTGGMTPLYAPPETFDGWVSRQSDQYSLAIVYQEMLTGRRPFPGGNTRQLIMQHLMAEPDLSSLEARDRSAIGRALAKIPDDRFPSCKAMVDVLKTTGVSSPTTKSGVFDLRRSQPRNTAETDTTSNPAEAAGRGTLRDIPSLAPSPQAWTPSRSNASAGRRSTPQLARPRTNGQPARKAPSVLTPTLIIGVGEVGDLVSERLSHLIEERFSVAKLPHLRWLTLDCDESVLAKSSNRISLTAKTLNAYQQNPQTAALLKDCDPELIESLASEQLNSANQTRFALISQQIEVQEKIGRSLQELKGATAIAESEKLSRLGVKSHKPQIIVLGMLNEPMGAGILCELSKMALKEMQAQEMVDPQIVGIIGVAPEDATSEFAPVQEIAQANTFQRCQFFTTPNRSDSGDRPESLPAELIFLELFAPMPDHLLDLASSSESKFSFVGLRRIVWPRGSLVRVAAHQLACQTLARWADEKEVKTDRASKVIDNLWKERRLDLPLWLTAVDYGLAQLMRSPFETMLQGIVQPLSHVPGKLPPEMDAALAVINQLLELIGQDSEKYPGRIGQVLTRPVFESVELTDAKMAQAIGHIIEQPGLRIAAALQGIQLFEDRLTTELRTTEIEAEGHARMAESAFEEVKKFLGGAIGTRQANSRRAIVPAEFSTKIVRWAKERYRYLRVVAVQQGYRKLLSTLPTYYDEVTLVRTRLDNFVKELPEPETPEVLDDGVHEILLPWGTRTFAEAGGAIVTSLGDAGQREFDEILQERICEPFNGIVGACVRTTPNGTTFQNFLISQAEKFVDSHANHLTASQAILKKYAGRGELQNYLNWSIDRATPQLADDPGQPVLVSICAPEDQPGQTLLRVARAICPGIVTTSVANDIIIRCEKRGLVALSESPAGFATQSR